MTLKTKQRKLSQNRQSSLSNQLVQSARKKDIGCKNSLLKMQSPETIHRHTATDKMFNCVKQNNLTSIKSYNSAKKTSTIGSHKFSSVRNSTSNFVTLSKSFSVSHHDLQSNTIRNHN